MPSSLPSGSSSSAPSASPSSTAAPSTSTSQSAGPPPVETAASEEESAATTTASPPQAPTPKASLTPRQSIAATASSGTALQQTAAAIDPEAPSRLATTEDVQRRASRPQSSQVLSNHAFDPPRPPPIELPTRGPVLPHTSTPTASQDETGASLATPRAAALNARPIARTTAYPPVARPPRHPWGKESDSRRLRKTLKSLYRLLRSLPLPLHRLIPTFLARAISRVLSHRLVRRMPTDLAFDIALFFWTCIVSIFFRVVQARGSWRIPKQKEGPVIFVAAPHHNQFLDPLLLASEVRRASGRRVAFLIAEKSIKRKFIGAAARIMQSIPVARAADSAKAGSGLITVSPDDPTLLIGLNTCFTKDLTPKGQIQLPKFTGYATAEIVEIISDTEVRIKKPLTNDKAKMALRGEVPIANGAAGTNAPRMSDKARAAVKQDAKDVGEWQGQKGCKYKALPFIDQTMMYAAVYERLAEGGSLGIFPEGGSHDRTDLLPLKAGVVIMALGAMAENPGLKVRIVPVGLHYFHADKFRSRAVIEFGAPMEVPQDSVAMFKEGGEGKRKAVGQCMDLVFDGLKSVTVRAPDYETLMLIQAGRRLYTPSGTHTSLGQVVELNRRFIMGYNKFKDEPRVIALKEDVLRYNKMLTAYGLRDHQVERAHRAGWRSLGLLLYRISLLCVWSTLALPGVVLNAPIFILAKLISRRKAKEALAASQVKIQGRDVLATWKVLVSLGVTPVLYTVYAALATSYARRAGWITTWRSALATPLAAYIALPLMSYSALKVGENSIDIYKSLPPLVVSLIPGNHKAIKRLQETRTRLAANLHTLIDELAPQVFEDFDTYRMLHPAVSAAPRPDISRRDSSGLPDHAPQYASATSSRRPTLDAAASHTDTETETGTETETETEAESGSLMFRPKTGVTSSGGTAVDVLSRPLTWADEKIFGWGRNTRAAIDRPGSHGRSGSLRRRPSKRIGSSAQVALDGHGAPEEGKPLLGAGKPNGENDADEEDIYESAEEGDGEDGQDDDDEDFDEDVAQDEEQDEGDYEAIFRMLSPGNILSAVSKSTDGKVGDDSNGALPRGAGGRRNRSRSRSQSGPSGRRSANTSMSTAIDDGGLTTPGPGELSFREKRNRSTDSLATLGAGGSRRGTRSPGWMTPTTTSGGGAAAVGASISRPSSRSGPSMMSPITRTSALPDHEGSAAPGAAAGTRQRTISTGSTGRRTRTHSLREAVPVDQIRSAGLADSDSLPAGHAASASGLVGASSVGPGSVSAPSPLGFEDAARKLEAEVRRRDASPEDKRKVRPELAAMASAEATPTQGSPSPFKPRPAPGGGAGKSSQ